MFRKTIDLVLILGAVLTNLAFAQAPVPDTPFEQEWHRAYPLGSLEKSNKIHTVAVDSSGTVWLGSSAGLFRLNQTGGKWRPVASRKINGPVFSLFVDKRGVLWVGAWNGLYRLEGNRLLPVPNVQGPIVAVCVAGGGGLALGPTRAYRLEKGRWVSFRAPFPEMFGKLFQTARAGSGLPLEWEPTTHLGIKWLSTRKIPRF